MRRIKEKNDKCPDCGGDRPENCVRCESCARARSNATRKAWRAKNIEWSREREAMWRDKNREKLREYNKMYQRKRRLKKKLREMSND